MFMSFMDSLVSSLFHEWFDAFWDFRFLPQWLWCVLYEQMWHIQRGDRKRLTKIVGGSNGLEEKCRL
jgi:hypothetical protein